MKKTDRKQLEVKRETIWTLDARLATVVRGGDAETETGPTDDATAALDHVPNFRKYTGT